MPSFDADVEQINVFDLGDFYVFKYYFELDEVFDEVRDFYNREEYRFEVPRNSLDDVKSALSDHYFELNVVDDLEPYTVVKRRYSDHPELLFKNAVLYENRGEYNVFLMKDELGVEQALLHDAERISETDLEVGF